MFYHFSQQHTFLNAESKQHSFSAYTSLKNDKNLESKNQTDLDTNHFASILRVAKSA